MSKIFAQTAHRILVPTDFSPVADAAIGYAIELAASSGAKVLLFHAVHLPVVTVEDPVAVINLSDLEMESDLLLEKTREDWIARTGYPNIVYRSAAGMATDLIADYSREDAVDLVVMGTHGGDGLGGWLLGTNATEISAKSGCPVLVVPYGLHFHPPKRILFLTDYSDNDFQSVFLTTRYFKRFHPEIIVAHVEGHTGTELEQHRFNRFKQQVRDSIPYDLISFRLIDSGNFQEAMEKFLAETDCDIITVSMRSRNFFDRLTGHSISRRMLRHANKPILVFHTHKPSGTPLF